MTLMEFSSFSGALAIIGTCIWNTISSRRLAKNQKQIKIKQSNILEEQKNIQLAQGNIQEEQKNIQLAQCNIQANQFFIPLYEKRFEMVSYFINAINDVLCEKIHSDQQGKYFECMKNIRNQGSFIFGSDVFEIIGMTFELCQEHCSNVKMAESGDAIHASKVIASTKKLENLSDQLEKKSTPYLVNDLFTKSVGEITGNQG